MTATFEVGFRATRLGKITETKRGTDMPDTSNEHIEKVLIAAPFADNESGIPQMCELIRALRDERNTLLTYYRTTKGLNQ